VAYRRERLELPDGDFLDFDWVDGATGSPVVVLFHGLEGSAGSPYARDLMAHARRMAGMAWWRIFVAARRGQPAAGAYFAGDSADIERILHHVKSQHSMPRFTRRRLARGNALLKWLGEQGEAARAWSNVPPASPRRST